MFGKIGNLIYRYRLVFAFYLSIVSHITILIHSFNSADSPYFRVLCGPPWIYEEEGREQAELVFEFGKPGDSERLMTEMGEGEEGEKDGEGEKGKSGGFARGKYEGGQWDKLIKDLDSTSELRKNFKSDFDNILPSSGVADSYVKRNRDYEDIIVKEVFPTLRSIADPFKVDVEEAEDNLAVHKERNRIIEEFRKGEDSSPPITMKLSLEGEKPPREPLQMGKPDRTNYLDSSIKRTKEKQLDEFISRFMGHDPNKGDLSSFVRDLYYENLQRLAYVFSGDPGYFVIDYFQENLNKEDFLKQMMSLLSENLGTKVGTEILFTLENIYDIQARALGEYFKSREIIRNATAEQLKTLRMETIRRVVEKYKPILKEKQIKNTQDVEFAYTKKRLEIMDMLLQNTPTQYRKNDGYFEKGRILWESGMFRKDEKMLEEAIVNWQKIDVKSVEGDFLSQKAFGSLQLAWEDSTFRDDSGHLTQGIKERIDTIVRYRLSELLEQKKIREDKLLWPKLKQKLPNP